MLTTKLNTVNWMLANNKTKHSEVGDCGHSKHVSSLCLNQRYLNALFRIYLGFDSDLQSRDKIRGETSGLQWIFILVRTSRHRFGVSVTETAIIVRRVSTTVWNLRVGKRMCTTLQRQSSHRTGYLLFLCEWNEMSLEQWIQWTKNLKTDRWILPRYYLNLAQ